MANNCYFCMQIAGKQKYEFVQALHEGFGRIYQINYPYCASFYNADCDVIETDGDCAWSIRTAMLDYHLAILTKRYEVSVEIYSAEPGCEFQEHYYLSNGELLEDECVEYREIWVEGFSVEEVVTEAADIGISLAEFYSLIDEDGYFRYGGFAEWDFPCIREHLKPAPLINATQLDSLLEVI